MNHLLRTLYAVAVATVFAPCVHAQDEHPPEYWENFKPSWSLNEPNAIRPAPLVGSSQNAAVAYFQTWDMLPRKEWIRLNELASNRPGEGKPLPKEIRDELLKQQTYIEALIRVSSLDHCDWGFAWESGWELLLPHLGYLRGSARVLAADTNRCTDDNSLLAAIDRIRAIVRLSQHSAEGPILISSLVGIAISSLSINLTNELLDHHTVTPAQARALLVIYRAIPRKDLYNTSASLTKEREITIGWLRDRCKSKEPGADFVRLTLGMQWNTFGMGEAFLSRFSPEQFEKDLNRADKLFDELERAWHSENPGPRLDELATEMREFQWGLIAIQMMPSYGQARGTVTRLESQLKTLEQRLERVIDQGNDSPAQETRTPP